MINNQLRKKLDGVYSKYHYNQDSLKKYYNSLPECAKKGESLGIGYIFTQSPQEPVKEIIIVSSDSSSDDVEILS